MIKFDEISFNGKCDVCGRDGKVAALCSTMGPVSFSYCHDCILKGLEPYDAMVSYISCAGKFPDDINDKYKMLIRNILKGLNITEEKFIRDVDNMIALE